jgi:hypothetical protein
MAHAMFKPAMPQPEVRLNCQLSPSQLLEALPFMSFVLIPCKPVSNLFGLFFALFFVLGNHDLPRTRRHRFYLSQSPSRSVGAPRPE